MNEDLLLDLLITAYIFGNENVNYTPLDKDKMYAAIYKKIDGKTWVDRLTEADTKDDLKKIAETESHRMFATGQFDGASDDMVKIWHTMEDDKVRDAHWYLDGMKVKKDEYFYTLDGERALHPGGFNVASLDINCRCYLEYRREGVQEYED